MSDDPSVAQEYKPQLVVKQPIFDRDKSVWGYKFVVNSLMAGEMGEQNPSDLITEQIASMVECDQNCSMGKKLLLNIEGDVSFDRTILPDSLDNYVVSMSGKVADVSQCTSLADSMRECGGCLAMDCDMEQDTLDSLMGKCDILKMSMAGRRPADIVALRKRFKEFDGQLLATDIADWETYEGTRALGFKYFQGPFFGVPEIKESDNLQATSIAKLQLLSELNNPNCGMDDLAKIIASDISLSYRIIRYINSASFGFRTQIKSIQQAVTLLGLKELKHWATVVVMTDIDSTPKGEEVAYMALHRARFLARFAELTKSVRQTPDVMFMLGLFSKLDALLSYPMDMALEDIPLDDEIRDGLCGSANEYRGLLRMLEAVEDGNCTVAKKVLGRYDADCAAMAAEYMKAATWTKEQLTEMKSE